MKRSYIAVSAVALIASLAIAGCGSSGSSSSSASSEATSAGGGAYGGGAEEAAQTTASSEAEALPVSLGSAAGVGKVLVDSKGMTLYYFEKDQKGSGKPHDQGR